MNVSNGLKQAIKGPVPISDIAVGMAFRGFLPGMEVRRRINQSDDTYSNIDRCTRDLFVEYRCHVEDVLAKMFGDPGAFATRTQFMEWACHLVTKWMDDDGFLKKFTTRLSRMMPVRDTCCLERKKYCENKEHLVDIGIEVTNWYNHVIFNGMVTVQLISKEVWI